MVFLRDKTGLALVRELGIAERSAYRITARIHEAMAPDTVRLFSGTVEVDATYVGGAWKNKRVHIRRTGTKQGKGTRKLAIFGVVQRCPREARAWLIPDEARMYTSPYIHASIALGSRVCSDEAAAYQPLSSEGYTHETVNHRRGEYARGDVHTQTLDGFWGLLKNFLAGKGGVRRGNLHHFVNECVWRYNHRHLVRTEQVALLLRLLKSRS